MKVSEVIDRLKVGDEVWVKGVVDVVYQGLHPSINIREVGWFSKNTEISLAEPQPEKVEVPDYVAELIRKYKAKKETLVCSISNLYRESDEYKWYVDNSEIYERAWVNGYTIKPNRWVVRTSSAYFEQFSGDSNHPFNFDATHNICVALTFNDSAKAEAVALLVDGSVEEV